MSLHGERLALEVRPDGAIALACECGAVELVAVREIRRLFLFCAEHGQAPLPSPAVYAPRLRLLQP